MWMMDVQVQAARALHVRAPGAVLGFERVPLASQPLKAFGLGELRFAPSEKGYGAR